MTELQEVLEKQGREAVQKKLKKYNDDLLLAELDDVLEFDFMQQYWKANRQQEATLKKKDGVLETNLYRKAIDKTTFGLYVVELRKRIHSYQKEIAQLKHDYRAEIRRLKEENDDKIQQE